MSSLSAVVLIAAATFAAPDASARPAPESFADLAERLSPAVVNISTAQNVAPRQGGNPFPPGSPFERFNEFFEEGQGGSPSPRRLSSLGSGFVIDPDGIIVTNNHVIESADEISVNFADGSTLEAEIVGRDEATDLAVLRVKPSEPLPHVDFGNVDNLRVGDWVMAIGNPFGLGGTVTAGIISARSRDLQGQYDDYLQTDASINRGNSGGPLFNIDGKVVGVNTAIISPTGGSIGIGFAVPADLAQNVVKQLIEFGETRRGWLGVRIEQVTEDIAESFGLDKPSGALVAGVTDESPADLGGVEPGDIILSFDGKDVESWRTLPRIVADTPIGKSVRVEVLREDKRKTLRVKIARLETSPVAAAQPSSKPDVQPSNAESALGLTLEPLTADNRRRYRIGKEVKGVLVTDVDPASDAAGKVAPGDVILEVAWQDVGSPGDAVSRIDKVINDTDRPVLLFIKRGDLETFRSIRAKK
ncbi:MAG: Do family serine endopeptidase [Pseudomonadota bacterium]